MRQVLGCRVENFNCVGQMGFNGLDVRRQVYFSQLQTDRSMAPDASWRFLLFELDKWPEDFQSTAQLWILSER